MVRSCVDDVSRVRSLRSVSLQFNSTRLTWVSLNSLRIIIMLAETFITSLRGFDLWKIQPL